jgi:NAD(P)-dependent dehydrogenase (short-subunit alcohol dehydrogenase family)
MSAEDFQSVVDTCFYGVVYTTRAAVPVMRKQKNGHTFQVSSVGGRFAIGGNTPYHAASGPSAVSATRWQWKSRRSGLGSALGTGRHSDQLGAARRAECAGPAAGLRGLSRFDTQLLRSLEGRSEGDPRKIAAVIVQLANSDEVPFRLILGVDAEKRVQQAEAARASEAEKWRHPTVSTVFEDGRFDSRLYMASLR